MNQIWLGIPPLLIDWKVPPLTYWEPDGYHRVTPYFTVSDADQLIEFLIEVFAGIVIVKDKNASGRVQHARVRIGDSVIMLNESNEDYPVNMS